MTDPNLTPRVDALTDARLATFRDAIADALKGTPLTDGRISASYDWRTEATVVRARVGLTIEGTVRLDDVAVGLAGDAYFEAQATRVGANMRHKWDNLTGRTERRAIVRQAIIDLNTAVGERDHESRDRRLEGVIARLEGLAR